MPETLNDKDKEIFLSALQNVLPQHESLISAVTEVFVALKQASPSWPHGINRLREFLAKGIEPETRQTLMALCKNQVQTKQDGGKWSETTRRLAFCHDPETRAQFLTEVAGGMSRVNLAYKYKLPVESVPLALTESLLIQRYGPIAFSQYSFNAYDPSSPRQRAKREVARQKPEWAKFGDFIVDTQWGFILPPNNAWPLPTPAEEIDRLNALLNADVHKENPTVDADFRIATSLSGVSVLPLKPSGKRRHPGALKRHIHGKQ